MKIENVNHIIADEGKVLRRISDSALSGKEVYLGYAYYLNGERVDPFLELPEHYEEIDEPITEDTPLITEEEPLQATEEEISTLEYYEQDLEIPDIPKRITYGDFMNLQQKAENLQQELEQLKQIIYGKIS